MTKKKLKASNDNRPAEFDQQLTEYLPYIRHLVGKAHLTRGETVDDVVEDVVLCALENWKKYDSSKGSFVTWLYWQTRSVLTIKKTHKERENRNFSTTDPESVLALRHEAPRQEGITYASQVISALKTKRYGGMLLQRAMGSTIYELGAKKGISHEKARQQTEEARRKIKRLAA